MSKVFTAAEAARECGVSRTTVQRMIAARSFPEATKTDRGWSIPLGDLLAAGLTPGLYTAPPTPDREHVRDHDQNSDQDMTGLTHEVELLRVKLLAAQALADERARMIDQMTTTMRALEASRPAPGQTENEGPITKIARRFRL